MGSLRVGRDGSGEAELAQVAKDVRPQSRKIKDDMRFAPNSFARTIGIYMPLGVQQNKLTRFYSKKYLSRVGMTKMNVSRVMEGIAGTEF